MTKSNHNINEVGESVSIIKTEILNLSKNFEDFKNDNKTFVASITKKADDNENALIEVRTKTNNLAIFQSVFSIIIGAIATYLGVNKQ